MMPNEQFIYALIAPDTNSLCKKPAVSIRMSHQSQSRDGTPFAELPKRWASFSDKPLISVDGDEIQVDAEAVRKLFERAGRERSPGGLESP